MIMARLTKSESTSAVIELHGLYLCLSFAMDVIVEVEKTIGKDLGGQDIKVLTIPIMTLYDEYA